MPRTKGQPSYLSLFTTYVAVSPTLSPNFPFSGFTASQPQALSSAAPSDLGHHRVELWVRLGEIEGMVPQTWTVQPTAGIGNFGEYDAIGQLCVIDVMGLGSTSPLVRQWWISSTSMTATWKGRRRSTPSCLRSIGWKPMTVSSWATLPLLKCREKWDPMGSLIPMVHRDLTYTGGYVIMLMMAWFDVTLYNLRLTILVFDASLWPQRAFIEWCQTPSLIYWNTSPKNVLFLRCHFCGWSGTTLPKCEFRKPENPVLVYASAVSFQHIEGHGVAKPEVVGR